MSTSNQAAKIVFEPRHRWALDLNEPRQFAVLLILPAELLLWFLILFPALMQIYLSVTAWEPTKGNWWQAIAYFNWGANFPALIFGDTRFQLAFVRTLVIVVVAVGCEFVLGFALALLFTQRILLRPLWISLLLVPMMTLPAVTGTNFFLLFQVQGPVNAILAALLNRPVAIAWLTDPFTAMIAIIVADVWQWTPLVFLILLSGLLALPQDQLNAARILGASWWQRFVYLTLPMMRRIMLIALIIRGMEALKIFDSVFLMTRGGPGSSTETVSIYLYEQAFSFLKLSYVAAAALIILVLLSLLTACAMRPLQAQSEGGE